MASAIFIGLVALGVVILLKPQSVVDLIQFRIPPESRSTRGSLPAAIFLIFVFSFPAFHSLPPAWQHWGRVSMRDPGQKFMAVAGGVFFLLYGVFACTWPLRFMRISSRRLAQVSPDKIDRRAMARIELVSRSWGALFLLMSAFLLQQF
jgi:hypothetical protein